jgi:hypothetical protein
VKTSLNQAPHLKHSSLSLLKRCNTESTAALDPLQHCKPFTTETTATLKPQQHWTHCSTASISSTVSVQALKPLQAQHHFTTEALQH